MSLETFVNGAGKKLVSEHGFNVDENDPNGFYKEIHDHFFQVFLYSIEENIAVFGFWHGEDRQFSFKQKSKLTGLLEREEFAAYLNDFQDWSGEWIVRKINLKGYSDNIDELIDIIAERFKLLEMEVNAIDV